LPKDQSPFYGVFCIQDDIYYSNPVDIVLYLPIDAYSTQERLYIKENVFYFVKPVESQRSVGICFLKVTRIVHVCTYIRYEYFLPSRHLAIHSEHGCHFLGPRWSVAQISAYLLHLQDISALSWSFYKLCSSANLTFTPSI